MFRSSRYKRNQGRIARQATFLALLAIVAVGAWRLSDTAASWGELLIPAAARDYLPPEVMGKYILPTLVLAIGAWAAFRIVNIPRFAEFLISVENEMNKVSWPSRAELYRASMVVIVVIFLLTAILFGYDLVLRTVITWVLGVPDEAMPMPGA